VYVFALVQFSYIALYAPLEMPPKSPVILGKQLGSIANANEMHSAHHTIN